MLYFFCRSFYNYHKNKKLIFSKNYFFKIFQEEADDFVREYELENDQGSIFFVQKQKGDVHCVVWDAALVLAKYLEKICLAGKNLLKGKRVIELGSGLGCVGLVAAFYGGHVTMTDLPQALPLLKLNLGKNKKILEGGKGSAKVEKLDWNDEVNLEPCDVLLASDCVYYKDSLIGLTNALKNLSTPSTEIYITQEKRSHSENQNEIWRDFVDEISKYFKMKIIPLREQHEEFRDANIYLLNLKKL